MFQVVIANLQPPPSLTELAASYGVSSEALRLWRDRGAPVHDPERLFRFIEEHGQNRGALWVVLVHDGERTRIADEITSL